jgi:hypothetical protein
MAIPATGKDNDMPPIIKADNNARFYARIAKGQGSRYVIDCHILPPGKVKSAYTPKPLELISDIANSQDEAKRIVVDCAKKNGYSPSEIIYR